MFAFLLPEIMIEVAYMTVEAFLLSGIVSSKYCRERQVVPEYHGSSLRGGGVGQCVRGPGAFSRL